MISTIFSQIERLILNERYKACGGMEKFAKLDTLYGNFGKSDSFLQFNVGFADEKKHQRVIGFAKPKLFHLLKYGNLRAHLDATFAPTPSDFYQTLIFGVMDDGTKMYIPIFLC